MGMFACGRLTARKSRKSSGESRHVCGLKSLPIFHPKVIMKLPKVSCTNCHKAQKESKTAPLALDEYPFVRRNDGTHFFNNTTHREQDLARTDRTHDIWRKKISAHITRIVAQAT